MNVWTVNVVSIPTVPTQLVHSFVNAKQALQATGQTVLVSCKVFFTLIIINKFEQTISNSQAIDSFWT